jgi:protein TonB
MKFIVKHIVYPAEAKDQGIMGRVFIGFTLTEKGEVENVVVLRGKHILLDKEAVRVIRKLKFKNPAQSKGEGKRVCLALPISFHLR